MKFKQWAVVLSTAILAACGGGSGQEPSGVPSQPPPITNSSGSGVFKEGTRLLTEEEAIGSTYTSDTLTVKKPQAVVYPVGTVLVVDGHGGRLIKITSVTQLGDSIVYGHEEAGLAQAFEKLDVAFQGALTRADLGDQFITNDPELEIKWLTPIPALAQASGQISDETALVNSPTLSGNVGDTTLNALEVKFKRFGLKADKGIEIDGNASFTLNPDFSLKLDRVRGATLPSLGMSALLSPGFNSSIALASKNGGQISYTFEQPHRLKPFKRIILVPVFGVPVPVPFWVTPVITLSGGVNGVAGSKFTNTYNYAVSGKFGIIKPSSGNYETISQLNNSATLVVSDVESELGILVSAPKIEIQFLIYSSAGPNFEIGRDSEIKGAGATQGSPPVEGVKVDGSVKSKISVGLKAGFETKGMQKLLGDFDFSYSPISIVVYENTLFEKSWFFPFNGVAAVTVRDNGAVPDDVFEVSLDGTVIGKTNKGGSGQFRLKNLRPGVRTITIKTIEDDSPPGTYEMVLGDGLTLSSGGVSVSGFVNLGQSVTHNIIVPVPSAP